MSIFTKNRLNVSAFTHPRFSTRGVYHDAWGLSMLMAAGSRGKRGEIDAIFRRPSVVPSLSSYCYLYNL